MKRIKVRQFLCFFSNLSTHVILMLLQFTINTIYLILKLRAAQENNCDIIKRTTDSIAFGKGNKQGWRDKKDRI